MKRKAVIYGCGNIGKSAYEYLKHAYDILFFVDKQKCGEVYDDVPVYEPKHLIECVGVKIIICTMQCWHQEILEDIKKLGIADPDIELYKINVERVSIDQSEIERQLDGRTIELGQFLLKHNTRLDCKELTFLGGGSGILDYVFLKTVAKVSKTREYLEVGTYIGESINNLTDHCERLYSVTSVVGEGTLQRKACQYWKIPDYSDRLAYDKKIIHYYGDSKDFDFSKHADTVDLYFIDGDHSYDGVYSDTKNIFSNKREDAIVIWHDFIGLNNQYSMEVVKAVKDVLGEEFRNVYVTNNNMCGIYVPPNRFCEFDFVLRERKYEENASLYTYDITIDNIQIK